MARKLKMGGTMWRKEGRCCLMAATYSLESNLGSVTCTKQLALPESAGREVTCLAPAQRLQVMVTPSPKMWNMGRAAIVTSCKN